VDSLTAHATPIFTQTQESSPVPDVPPVIDMARLNLQDPFENALWRMVTTYRDKKHDYTPEGASPWWNFDHTEADSGLPFNGAVMYEIGKKRRRLQALRDRGGSLNEPIEDTYQDIAVYGAIAYARYLYPDGDMA
jgi:hypothetical protein